jgi:2-desacetyl-2-hydroxyethyl bacteriochlorophyllide A dehydrogenase
VFENGGKMEKTYTMAFVTAHGKVEFQEKILPELTSKEVLIGVKACSICGGDLHIFKGKHPFAPLPVAIGHELSGEILRTGGRVSKLKEGDRVVVEPVIVCGDCYFCQRGQYHLCMNISFQYRKGQGGFAPYFVADEDWVHKLPGSISYEEGALIEPLSVAVHAVKKGRLQLGDTVAIFGAGPIGLLMLLLTRLSGAGEVFLVDVQDHRLRKAKEFGASEVLNNAKKDAVPVILEKTSFLGVDRAFEAVGLENTLIQSLKVLKKGGASILVGLFEAQEARIPANLFVQKEISLAGAQGYCWDFQEALKLVEHGQIKLRSLISRVLPISSIQQGFELLLDSKNEAVKVVLKIE